MTPATYAEIWAQGQTLAATLARLQGMEPPPFVLDPGVTLVFTGCGSSYYLAQYGAGLVRALAGRPALAVPSGELWLLPDLHLPPAGCRVALVAISRSGSTSEVVHAVATAARRGVPAAAITCAAASPLAARSAWCLDLTHVQEASVVQTQSCANHLLALHWLAAQVAAAAGRDEGRDYAAALPRLVAAVGEALPQLEAAAQRLVGRGYEHFVYLGSGPLAALAREGMLKMKEMTQLLAEAYHTLEFRHGPMATVTPRTLVVLLPCQATAAASARLAQDLAALGAHCVLVAPAGLVGPVPPGVEVVDLPTGLPEWQWGSLALPLLQFLAYHQTRRLGLDPDAPRHLAPVVRLEGEVGA